ncbi:glycosyltransferase family 4 protein [Candidatus Saccharibacteria bacterium]|nr:MAG: glycosyltransferase family 4 protein [Candidatus Saccharibacteria bacterium]
MRNKDRLRLRICDSSPYDNQRSGVGNYSHLLRQAFEGSSKVVLSPPRIFISKKISGYLYRLMEKLYSHGFPVPYDILLPQADLTLFTNFSTWPTLRTNSVMTVVHDLTYINYPEVVERKNLAHLRRVVPRSITRADTIITVSESMKKEICNVFAIRDDKVIVTRIPPSPEFSIKANKDVHSMYRIPAGKYFLFVSNLEPRKNLKVLIKAYRLLPVSIRNTYSLVIAGGKGWKFEETQALIDEPLDVGTVCQVGFVDQSDLPALFQKASLFVMPSLYEGFGMPIVEALASGCKVVASDIPVFHESGGGAIHYANPHDESDFASKIIHAIKTPLDNNAVRKHLATLTWDSNVETILDGYRATEDLKN